MQSGGFESQTLLHSSSNRKGFYQCNLEGGVLSCRMEHVFQTVEWFPFFWSNKYIPNDPHSYPCSLDILKKIDGIEQVNLDFETEEDMKRKFQVGLALQPVCAVW